MLLESVVFDAAIVPAVPATITPAVKSATSSPDRDRDGARLRPEGLSLAITVVLIPSSSNALRRDLPSRKRRTTFSLSSPQ